VQHVAFVVHSVKLVPKGVLTDGGETSILRHVLRAWRNRAVSILSVLVLLTAAVSGLWTGGLTAQQLPLITTQLTPVFGTAGSAVTFSAVPISGPVSQYQWDFGDGQQGFGPVTTHTYAYPGTYTVTLTALGPLGTPATGVTTATISPAPIPRVNGVVAGSSSVATPLAFVTVNAGGPYSGSVGVPVGFSASSNASVPQFTWDFGDGQAGSGPAVSHPFSTAGTFFVRVTVYDQATGNTGVGSASAVIAGPGAAPPAAVAPSTAIAAGAPVVRYPAGWNLVAGPSGTSFPQALGSLYTLQPGDSSYEPLPSGAGVQSGAGYWAYFPQPAGVSLSGASTDTAILNLSPGEVVLAGNPSTTATLTIRGADIAMGYDAVSGRYRDVQSLPPGSAAWVSIGSGGAVTLSP
jgi:PKD repeat protein